jgi:hypothetical protein
MSDSLPAWHHLTAYNYLIRDYQFIQQQLITPDAAGTRTERAKLHVGSVTISISVRQPLICTFCHPLCPLHCRQFRLLLRRSWRQITRDKAAAMARLSSNMSSAIIFGAIFWRMQKKQSNIQDRMGLLQVGFCYVVTC